MLKNSFGIPRKAAKQLDGMPTIPDLELLVKQAGVSAARDYGVQWNFNDVEFKLYVRYEGHKIVWRMWNTRASDAVPPWESNERELRALLREITTCCNEIAGIKSARPAASAPSAASVQAAPTRPQGPMPSGSKQAPETNDEPYLREVSAQPTPLESSILKSMGTADGAVDVDPAIVQAMTSSLMAATFHVARWFGAQLNAEMEDKNRQVLVVNVGEITDFMIDPVTETHREERMIRWRASTVEWCLSARARFGRIDFFLVPVADAISVGLADRELDSIGTIVLAVWLGEPVWTIDGLPATPTDIRRMLLKGLSIIVNGKPRTKEEVCREVDLRNLAQRIVSQQEEVQRRISRDLHDAVIADITLLKRAMLSETALSRDEVASSLDAVIARLREICYELSPSDLKDWGLATTLEALVEQVGARTGARCMLNFLQEVPPLDAFIELHVFRIIQEALNNSAKYSGATQISVTAENKHGWLSFCVRDNGRGFDVGEEKARSKHGGQGRTSMQERVEMIRTAYPAILDIASQPGSGTTTTLFIKVRD